LVRTLGAFEPCLAALGEVESIHGPFCNPPGWMLSYNRKVSANHGDRIKPKQQNEKQVGLANQLPGS
jgi:hypothetical protein